MEGSLARVDSTQYDNMSSQSVSIQIAQDKINGFKHEPNDKQ